MTSDARWFTVSLSLHYCSRTTPALQRLLRPPGGRRRRLSGTHVLHEVIYVEECPHRHSLLRREMRRVPPLRGGEFYLFPHFHLLRRDLPNQPFGKRPPYIFYAQQMEKWARLYKSQVQFLMVCVDSKGVAIQFGKMFDIKCAVNGWIPSRGYMPRG